MRLMQNGNEVFAGTPEQINEFCALENIKIGGEWTIEKSPRDISEERQNYGTEVKKRMYLSGVPQSAVDGAMADAVQVLGILGLRILLALGTSHPKKSLAPLIAEAGEISKSLEELPEGAVPELQPGDLSKTLKSVLELRTVYMSAKTEMSNDASS